MKTSKLFLFIPIFYFFLIPVTTVSQETTFCDWKAYVSNSVCLDWTWCVTDGITKELAVELMLENLKRMEETDNEPWANQHRFTCTVTNEILFFFEKYPERKKELIDRIKQGRIMISPFLSNSLWGFQSVETFLRSMYPAKKLANEAGIALNAGVHIELPSLPWGVVPLLAGSGINWCSVPFLKYDSEFNHLTNPPLFKMEGPDGSIVNISMDAWACLRSGYWQAAPALRDPNYLHGCIKHYEELENYPCRFFLMDGSHGDLLPSNLPQVNEFSKKIIEYNRIRNNSPELVSSTFTMFCDAVDSVESVTPFMPVIKGGFGHSWELWPVSLAKYTANFRENERRQVCAEALLSVSGKKIEKPVYDLQEKLDYTLAMMNDHAWNECKGLYINAYLRKDFTRRLDDYDNQFHEMAWNLTGLEDTQGDIIVFNPSNYIRKSVVRFEVPVARLQDEVKVGNSVVASQVIHENGKNMLYFVLPEITGFGFKTAKITENSEQHYDTDLKMSDTVLENSYYKLTFDVKTKQVESLIYKPSGKEYLSLNSAMIDFNYFFNDKDNLFIPRQMEVIAKGPVVGRLKVSGEAGATKITYYISIYAGMDKIDIDVEVHKEPEQTHERLEMRLSMLTSNTRLHLETPGAVIIPEMSPAGNLQPGADLNRFAVQGFVDACDTVGKGFICTSLDAFCLRRDLTGTLNFELLGNDMNYKESIKGQNGERDFNFRFSLKAYSGGYNNARCFAFSRDAMFPLMIKTGGLKTQATQPSVSINGNRAVVTAFKPASPSFGEGNILRFWETAGESAPVIVHLIGYREAVLCDLLENDIKTLKIVDNKVEVDVKPYGFGAVRLIK